MVIVNLVEALEGIDEVLAKESFVSGGVSVSVICSSLQSLMLSCPVHDVEDISSLPPIATIYIVADLESTAGRALVRSALELVVSPSS